MLRPSGVRAIFVRFASGNPGGSPRTASGFAFSLSLALCACFLDFFLSGMGPSVEAETDLSGGGLADPAATFGFMAKLALMRTVGVTKYRSRHCKSFIANCSYFMRSAVRAVREMRLGRRRSLLSADCLASSVARVPALSQAARICADMSLA